MKVDLNPFRIVSKFFKFKFASALVGMNIFFLSHYFLSPNLPNKTFTSTPKKDLLAEPLITLTGKLRQNFYEHFHEDLSSGSYSTITPYWFIELDQPSWLLALNLPEDEFTPKLEDLFEDENPNQMMLISMHDLKHFFEKHKDQQIAVKGTIFYAHRICHRTPMIMDTQQIFPIR